MAIVTESDMSTYLDEPPAYDFKDLSPEDQKDLIGYAHSVSSSATDVTAQGANNFSPSKTLLLNAKGIRMIRFPIPSGELEIQITTTDGDLAYVSTREKRHSSNAVLHNASGKQLLASEYQFGPGRAPKIRFLPEIEGEGTFITTKGKWTSRRQNFVLPDGKSCTWKYVYENDAFASRNGKEKKRTHLVLELSDTTPISEAKGKSGRGPQRRVAELVRNDEARTPNTRSTHAGNGGQLKIDVEYCEAVGLREDVVVASCLMMLKKEIDRRRMIQIAMMAAIAGAS